VDITRFQYIFLFNNAKQTFSSLVYVILQYNWHFRTEPNPGSPISEQNRTPAMRVLGPISNRKKPLSTYLQYGGQITVGGTSNLISSLRQRTNITGYGDPKRCPAW